MQNKFYLFLKIFLFYLLLLCQMLSSVSCNSKNVTYADTFSCCSGVFGSCKTACENLSLVQLASESVIRDSRLQNIKTFCPYEVQTDFWTCMNQTLNAISQGSHWLGRQCCKLAISQKCQNGCATTASKSDLIDSGSCRISDEFNLISCIDELESNQKCCSVSKTSQCMQICQDILKKKSLFPELKGQLYRYCEAQNQDVLKCVQKSVDEVAHPNWKQYITCCDRGSNEECKSTCRNLLKKKNFTDVEIVDSLEPSCGSVIPSDPIWQCFLSGGAKQRKFEKPNEMSRINQIGIDSAKLQCCYRATSAKCRRICTNTYTKDWTETRGNFELECLQNVNEMALKRCIEDVEEPCELGCDGLSFCSNFNNRPTELFRNCNDAADQAAQLDVKLWKEQQILRLPGFDIPIRNITYCSPDTWRAIACTLQIKPCTRSTHFNQICREDCYDLLTKCMDWSRIGMETMTASSLCSKFSPENSDVPCISIKPFLEPSDLPYTGNDLEVLSPCKGNPCNSTQVCQVNRDGSNSYTCLNGCPLGEASPYLIPIGSYVRIPMEKECFKICHCGESGRIENCQPIPCVSFKSCSIGDRRIEHNSWFQIECNICSCYAGEITCTKRQCRMASSTDRSFTTLPCNCPPHHVPVCGKNGNTYPSACIAKCTGLQDSDIEFGACENKDPCNNNECPKGTSCIPDRNICLTVMHKPCPQYRCVNQTANCKVEPITDTDANIHVSPCDLVQSNAKFAYYGMYHESICRSAGQVCGINGVTYNSECEAISDFSMVDYSGACRAVGLINDESTEASRCVDVKCEKRLPENCLGIVPPGACCPVCGGVIRIVYSRKQIDRSLYALQGRNTESLTLKAILRSLQSLIKVSQCYLSGFLTFETDIFVVVYSIHKNPTHIQIESCKREAEKLSILIETKSHFITSDLGLSSLTVANVIKPIISASSIHHSSLLGVFLVTLISLISR